MNQDALDRLAQLETRLNQLERRSRFPGWLAVLACGFVGGWLGHLATSPTIWAQAGNPQEIVARSLKIVDEQGRALVTLSSDQLGGAARILNRDGRLLVAVESDPDGGLVRIHGQDGLERSFLGVGDRKGGGLLYFRNPEGKNNPMSLGVGPKGGYLVLNNLTANKRSVWLGTDDEDLGGVVFAYDLAGKVRCDFGCNKQGGALNLYGTKNEKSHVYLGTGGLDLGGLLLLRDTDGKTRVETGQGKAGGYVALNGNKNDACHLSLATFDDQRGGYLQVQGNDGKVKVELGVNASGQGYVDTFEKR